MRIRSLLFTPATTIERVPKAVASGADWVVIDLEDGVGPSGKDSARQALVAHLGRATPDALAVTAVRINPLTTADGVRDLAALLDVRAWPGMIVLPKVEARKEIEQIRSVAEAAGQSPALMPTLETATGLEDAAGILRCCGPRVAVGYGSADHSAEIGSTMGAAALAWARGRIVNACGRAGIPAIDGACLDIRDEPRLRDEAALARDMGFAGKVAIHPAQVAAINAAFTPTAEALANARAMIAAAARADGGAFSFEGKMIDAPVLARARRVVAAAGMEA